MRKGKVLVLWAMVALLMLPGQLKAEPDESLGRAVPADVWLYGRYVHNPERDYMKGYFANIKEAFQESGIQEEIASLIQSTVPPAEKEEMTTQWEKWSKLLGAVDWAGMLKEEFAYTLRFQKALPIPELLVLSRTSKEEVAKNLEALKALLTELANLRPELNVTTTENQGARIVTLSMGAAPVALSVASTQDCLLLCTSPLMRDESLSLLTGKGSSILDSPRYKEAMAKLPSMEDGEAFVDVGALFATIRGLVPLAAVSAPENTELQGVIAAAEKFLGHLDILDYAASVKYTEGYTNLTESVVTLKPGAESSGLYPVFANQPLVSDFHKLIPDNAITFTVSNGINPHQLYKFVEKFVAEEIPNGPAALAQWQEMQGQIDFNLDQELLSTLEGGTVVYAIPALVPNPMSPTDTVIMLKVKDKAKLEALIEKGLAKLKVYCQAKNLMFSVLPVTGTAPYKFRSISFQFMPTLQPHFGFADDYLVIATSSGAANKVAALMQDEAPNVLSSSTFAALKAPKGSVSSLSYTNLQPQIQMQAQMIGMMGMYMSMLPIPESPETVPIKKMMMLLPRLAPVIKAFDFLEHQLTTSSFDKANGTWQIRRTLTIRPPVK